MAEQPDTSTRPGRKRPVGLLGIAYCYYSIHHRNGDRVTKVRRILSLGVAPIILGILLALRLGSPPGNTLQLVVAVMAVLAAVLIGLLPLAHSILAQTDSVTKYTIGERAIAQRSIDRVQVLQDLHASISWAVILLVVGLASSAFLVLLGAPFTSSSGQWERGIEFALIFILYTVMASTAFTFFDVATGIFEAMESHAESLKRRIRGNMGSTIDTEDKDIE